MDELGDLVRKVVLPKSRRNQVLMLAHGLPGAGHFGNHKTHAWLNSYFTWPGMVREIAEHCRSYKGCQLASPDKNPRAPLKPLPCIGQRFELLAMDLVGPLERTQRGRKYILTAMYLFSKYPAAPPLKRVDTESVVEGLVEILSRHGLPETVLTDQGSVFMSGVKKICDTLGISQIRTSPYHPQSDGALEWWHACLNILDATRHLSGVRTYSPHTPRAT